LRSPGLLLVEDHPDDVELILRAFREAELEYETELARDADEALERLLGPRPLPAVVVLDLALPQRSGLDVLRALRADPRTRALPVVVLTGAQDDDALTAAYTLGANSCVQKPRDYAGFITTVRQLGRYWLTLNEAAHRGTPS
jgi:two-component system response regulator